MRGFTKIRLSTLNHIASWFLPEEWAGQGGESSHYPKNCLVPMYPIILPKKCWIYNFHSFCQFCPKCSPTSQTLMGNWETLMSIIAESKMLKKADKLSVLLNYAFMICIYRLIFGLCCIWWYEMVVCLC